ncbi:MULTISPECIES: ParA family protein [unclassified Aureimonas]|uniref:ParA family protein n=1 Tax=unclassified Aureimonas TaxID=2615206 RepID=UPI0006FCAC88|nr:MULTISPECIES: ParA family protein [unclassified Aureimonas]KQT69072.1 hypothetical protein ASG54_05340 [Aureimonas sp. Leaf460]KQT69310.1 hypothetical protein ASG62_17945 [Aureimonas sp. Leaf427]
MPSRVIAVANCKGGTGKTTTAVNVSAELARRGRRVLLVDLDPQGHAGFGFGVFAAKGDLTAHDFLGEGGHDMARAIRPTRSAGVDVLPADRSFRVRSASEDQRRLSAALATLGERYDTVVIDTPPAAEAPLRAALAAAGGVLIPTQLQHLTYDGLMQLSRLVFETALGVNPTLRDLAIVPVQVDIRMHLQQRILAELLMEFGHERIFRGIRTDVALAEAFGSHCPVHDHRRSSRGARDYDLLAEDVVRFWKI